MTTDDIKKMSVYMMDKDGNGYVGNVPEGFYPLIAGCVKFVKVDKDKFEMAGIENFVSNKNQ
jgi:hypothetical protein